MNSTANCTATDCAGCDAQDKCKNATESRTVVTLAGLNYPKVAAFDSAVSTSGTTEYAASTASCGSKVACLINQDCDFIFIDNKYICKEGATSGWNPDDASEIRLGFVCPRE